LGILAHVLTWSLVCDPAEATAALPKVDQVLNETLVEYESPVPSSGCPGFKSH